MRPLRAVLASVVVFSGVLSGVASAAGPAASHWSVQPSPNPNGAAGSFLAAVSCANAIRCEAVGLYGNGTVDLTLAERWDGSAWSVEATPNPSGARFSELTGVSCPGSKACVAVGFSISGAGQVHALVEVRSGSRWRIEPTPVPPQAFWDELVSVSCLTITDCTAVGGFIKNGPDAQELPLAEHWDGSGWSIEAVPNPHAENGSSLEGVSCVAPAPCEAAGGYAFADVEASILAFGWDGSAWSRQRQGDPGGGEVSDQHSVSCSAAAACTAVGSWDDDQGLTRALAERWNGARWVRQSTVEPQSFAIADLSGVSCPSDTSCLAAGSWSTSINGIPEFTLAERWNGMTWKIERTPNPPGADLSGLNGIDCTSAGSCVAVGSTHVGGVFVTLVEVRSP
jgi:hypothetical protein